MTMWRPDGRPLGVLLYVSPLTYFETYQERDKRE